MRHVMLLLALSLLLPTLPAQAASPTSMVAKTRTQQQVQVVRQQVEAALHPARPRAQTGR